MTVIGFPNAVKIAFTGTPLLTERHKQTTYERFGIPIDTYKMHESVADRATVDILYIGRTSKDSPRLLKQTINLEKPGHQRWNMLSAGI